MSLVVVGILKVCKRFIYNISQLNFISNQINIYREASQDTQFTHRAEIF